MKEDFMLVRRIVLAAFFALAGILPAAAQQKVPVVATFSILGDLVKNVGGDRVEVTTLVGPNGDAHVYQPSPADAKKVADSKIVFINGLGLEGWLSRLVKASGTKGNMVVTTKGIQPIAMKFEEAGEEHKGHEHKFDPHAWQSVANAKIYVANIRDALIAADPAGKEAYAKNASAYLARLDKLEADVKAAMAKIPAKHRRIITTHDAFGYFGAAYGVEFIAPQGVSTETEASAKDVAKIIRQIKAEKIPAVFMENISDPRLIQQIAKETKAKIGGTVYSDSLSDAKGPASSYIDMIEHNIRQFSAALTS
jgi:zinc/manganese transport system substrate-binding protein